QARRVGQVALQGARAPREDGRDRGTGADRPRGGPARDRLRDEVRGLRSLASGRHDARFRGGVAAPERSPPAFRDPDPSRSALQGDPGNDRCRRNLAASARGRARQRGARGARGRGGGARGAGPGAPGGCGLRRLRGRASPILPASAPGRRGRDSTHRSGDRGSSGEGGGGDREAPAGKAPGEWRDPVGQPTRSGSAASERTGTGASDAGKRTSNPKMVSISPASVKISVDSLAGPARAFPHRGKEVVQCTNVADRLYCTAEVAVASGF